MKLILFDIDGTLIRSNRAGRIAMGNSLIELFGSAGPLEEYPMSGKTDRRILTDILVALGKTPAEVETLLPQVYEKMTEQARLVYPGRGIKSCVGVAPLLAALNEREDILLGLLTGNVSGTAPLKLSAAGIAPHQFRVGAFGSEAIERNHLPAMAMTRANQLTDHNFTGNNTIIVGDTPADILCARAGKATAVAVASGWHSAATLAKYQPDFLLDNLGDTERVLEILLNTEKPS